MITSTSCACGPAPAKIVMIAEKTDRVAGLVPQQVRARAHALAGSGGGELRVYAAGRTVAEIGRINLLITRGGQSEGDDKLRRLGVDRRLESLGEAIAASKVGARGFDLYAALQAAEDAAAEGSRDVTLATTVLGSTVPPLDMARLTAADPKQAVEHAMKGPLRTIDLSGVVLRPVLLTPVGQKPLSAGSEVWREQFIVELGTALGARVVDPVRNRETSPPWAHPSMLAPIPSIETDPGPRRIDAAAFRPETAVLLDPQAVQSKIKKIIGSYAAGSHVLVTGYCAKFGGNADSARALSRDRAQVITDLLVEAGVSPKLVRTVGKGWDVRADNDKPATDKAQRVVIVDFIQARDQ
ncbi:OmpA family protein [Nonomuraea insulae]|uniref:OmpA family protein n=1 Tax=Nonomuraea insulae TaxID=1616787 RepID=A0ABW1D9Y6_9ACTN